MEGNTSDIKEYRQKSKKLVTQNLIKHGTLGGKRQLVLETNMRVAHRLGN